MATQQQVSAGGVVSRRRKDGVVEVAMIATGAPGGSDLRWGLPKGMVAPGESHEATAVREVREETGLTASIMAPLTPIEYWYWGHEGSDRVRYHKRVYFFLMAYLGGDLADHDWEVREACWFSLVDAQGLASFPSERQVLTEVQSNLHLIE
jgi:8-oxo-dGTP diphosphatase